MCASSRGTLQALFLPNRPTDPGEMFGSIAVWCPWCEDVHFHGAAGQGDKPRIEARGAHCCPDSGSPFIETGYRLEVAGRADNAAASLPDCAYAGPTKEGKAENRSRRRFRLALMESAPALTRAIVGAMTGRRGIDLKYDQVKLPGTLRLHLYSGAKAWAIHRHEPPEAPCGTAAREGRGNAALAAALFGTPESIAAVRLLEAALNVRLDIEAVAEIEAAIDAWIKRGAPERRKR